ncbi:MAG: iron-sulfur cluster assembly accessory protein [Bacteroidota bacterium]
MTSDILIPVSLSPKAANEVRHIMENKNIPDDYGLRIGIKGSGGCSGFNYLLGFDKKKDSDISFEVDGIMVYVEKKHTMYLLDLEVDFYEGSDAKGFTFTKKS